jgi:para-nitrobenzyl esterase
MVYQHGGGFVVGSGASPWQDGARLAVENDVVVVESNHRLGIMGYLYLGHLLGDQYPGNQGLKDLVMVLRWVKRNIAAFGGDPANVTIFGESGGGGKTACLYAMPSAAPYFHKASIESPIGPGHMDPDAAAAVTREVMRRLDITDAQTLLTVPVEALIKAQMGGCFGAARHAIAGSTFRPAGHYVLALCRRRDSTRRAVCPFRTGIVRAQAPDYRRLQG